jgi:selenoprotein W-related protein
MPSIAIEYCHSCGFLPGALELIEAILTRHKQNITQCILVPSDGGRFEIIIDGKLVYSRLKEGVSPKEEDIQRLLEMEEVQ